ncbi:MAG: hypothetical protein LQ342_001692 [Letrouitia transgressa]|nr:MAG: hypothetical protein LQ342_001692 [Letrouitia transgressa]
MSEVQSSTNAATTEPVNFAASEATKDPVRPNGTNDLTAESRPEVTDGAVAPSTVPTAPVAENPATDGATEKPPKGTAVVEAEPINEGVLSYKAPGLVKGLIFSKKYFWFSDEPVEHNHLSEYVRGEKATDVAHDNAAHATQTGKGLLFFAKRVEDKPQPAGILNLADVTDVAKGEFNDFSFKLKGHKHQFQARTRKERDGWLVAIETKGADARTSREGVTGSEGYKSSHEKFAKPAAVGAGGATSRSLSRPKKTTETKAAESTTPTASGAGAGGDASSSDEGGATKNKNKSRSQSRKRGSVFGALLGKKEQHDEKKEIKKEEKEEEKKEKAEEKAVKSETKKEEKGEKEEKKAVKNDGVVDPTPLDAAAVASRVMGEPVVPEGSTNETKTTAATKDAEPTVPVSETTTTSTAARETTSKPNKRNSIFGSLFSKKETPTSPVTANETSPTSPTKDSEPAAVSPTAPQLSDPVKDKDIAPTSDVTSSAPASEPTAAAENAPAATSTASPTSPDTSKANRRSSFFGMGSKKEKKVGTTSDAEGTDGEGKKSGGFSGLLRKASRAQGSKPNKAATANNTTATAESETPAPVSKETQTAEAVTDGEDAPKSSTNATAATEPGAAATASQQTPVQATA